MSERNQEHSLPAPTLPLFYRSFAGREDAADGAGERDGDDPGDDDLREEMPLDLLGAKGLRKDGKQLMSGGQFDSVCCSTRTTHPPCGPLVVYCRHANKPKKTHPHPLFMITVVVVCERAARPTKKTAPIWQCVVLTGSLKKVAWQETYNETCNDQPMSSGQQCPFRLPICTCDALPRGCVARVDRPTKSRKD